MNEDDMVVAPCVCGDDAILFSTVGEEDPNDSGALLERTIDSRLIGWGLASRGRVVSAGAITIYQARVLASSILNLADKAEGKTPLLFQPTCTSCPTCTGLEPVGHPDREDDAPQTFVPKADRGQALGEGLPDGFADFLRAIGIPLKTDAAAPTDVVDSGFALGDRVEIFARPFFSGEGDLGELTGETIYFDELVEPTPWRGADGEISIGSRGVVVGERDAGGDVCVEFDGDAGTLWVSETVLKRL